MSKKKKAVKQKKKIPLLEFEDYDTWVNRLKQEEQEVTKNYEASFIDYKQSSQNLLGEDWDE